MRAVLPLSRGTTIDMYIYTKSFQTRKPIPSEGCLYMTNMYLVPLLDFDVSGLAGKAVRSATLTMTCLNDLETLAVDVSTVSQDWNAAVCTNYNCDVDKAWAYDGWMTDVVMSAGHSRYFREKVEHGADGRTAIIPINPAVVEAMAAGQSFGMLVMDAKSRFYGGPEAMMEHAMRFAMDPALGPVPTLTVEYEDAPALTPAALTHLTATPLSVEEESSSAVQLTWALGGTYSPRAHLELFISETSAEPNQMDLLPKYLTPNLGPGCLGTLITGLKPHTTYHFAARVRDGGEVSAPVFADALTLNEEIIPDFPKPILPELADSRAAFVAPSFQVGVTDDLAKINPQDGSLYAFDGDATWNTGIFQNGAITLAAAKGESTAFQLSIQAENPLDFTIEAQGSLAPTLRFFQLWCVQIQDQWVPDAVVPIRDGRFSLPFAENKIPNQKQLTLWVDCVLPESISPGLHENSLILRSGSETLTLPLTVDIAPFALKASDYRLELNGYVYLPECSDYHYGDPEAPDIEREYYRLGYQHHGVINILPYSHIGTLQPGFAPQIGQINGEMHVTDWSEWDAHFAQYLDGSYIEDLAGERVPISHIYLPFHENWPMTLEEYYKIQVPDLPYPDNVTRHVQLSGDIYEDFRPGYREGIKSVMKDFAAHFEEKGWKNIEFQYFFNNKNFYKKKNMHDRFPFGNGLAKWLGTRTSGNNGEATSWWLLDEPHFRADWEALRYYATILREVQAETGAAKQIKFRADLSCYFQAFDFLDGLLDTNVVGGTYANHRENILRRRKRLFGEVYWPYGSWNAINRDNGDSVRWILDVYLKGSRGIVPWYSFGLDLNYEVPDTLAVIYPGKRFNTHEAIASTRLKAGRKAMELVRYCDAMKRAFGYSDHQLRAYIATYVSTQGKMTHTSTVDAGTASYAQGASALEALKRDMHRRLTVMSGMYF